MGNNVLVLYSNLTEYMYNCFSCATSLYDINFFVIKKRSNSVTPFIFPPNDKIKLYDVDEMSYDGIVGILDREKIGFVLCSGWNNALYRKIARRNIQRNGGTSVLLLDSFYHYTLKQKLNLIVAPLFLKRYFNRVWVPGYFQFEYARRIGFKKEEIFTGVYAANLKIFNEKSRPVYTSFNRCFYYVGRLIDVKGVKVLLSVLTGMTEELESRNWTFCIIGNGKYEKEYQALSQRSKSIKYLPFMQPEKLKAEMSGGGVFVLPSILESWGLVVQEFAVLGFPLLLSDHVGAYPHFLIDRYNGLLFRHNSESALKQALCKIMDTGEEELIAMGKRSSEVSNDFTPAIWAAKLNTMILQSQKD